jgi:L-ribulose-5-phosphate 4-epimerase
MAGEEIRNAIAQIGRKLEHEGLLSATAGNLSARLEPEVIAITPSNIPYPDITAADVVITDLRGNVLEGTRRPSSELPFHTAVYRARADVGAVVHTHSLYATTLAILRRPIPAVHYVIASFGVAEIPVVPYETYGSDALAAQLERVAQTGTKGALLANHGAVVFDSSLEGAARLAALLEFLATIYVRAVPCGEPVLLAPEEIERVIERYKTHGQPLRDGAGEG